MRILIAGPPASGKSTLAQLLAEDIGGSVIDYDLIAAEFGSTGHEHPKAISDRAHAEVARRMRLDGSAVLVKSAPDRADREALAREFRADEVRVIPLPADEAKARAASDGRPSWTADAIDKWWSRYEPSPIDKTSRSRTASDLSRTGAEMTAPVVGEPTTDPAPESPPAQGDLKPEAPAKPETDWKVEAKKWEARAKENKTAADRLTQIEEANKTEAQKVADRLAAAEKDAVDARRDASRFKIAAEFQLSPDDAAALEHVATEDGMRLIAERLAGNAKDRKKQGNHVPREGTQTNAPESAERETVRNLFGS